ncbi:hypothetical protein M9Y10_000882 [Tritrichomonas musculus]|uniref:DUF1963 domain-containing protein n=1 Tax=Tritrichomonas musculus TaxID=1915356 RepID=A0ABR2L5E1_9EUKA
MLKEPALKEEEKPYWNFFLSHNLWKTGYAPVCKSQDSNSPKVSKFGGSCPHLPQDSRPICKSCNGHLEVLLQLYIPSLPAPVKQLFPENLQNSLIVFTYCTECMSSNEEDSISWNVYNESDFGNLVFDSPPSEAKIEPAVIESWQAFKSIDGSTEHYYSTFQNQKGDLDDLKMEDFVRELKENYAGTTYLLGNPDFTEGEYQPEPGMVILASFAQDKAFSMMWGDAGYAHLWMKPGNDFGEFNLFWTCG